MKPNPKLIDLAIKICHTTEHDFWHSRKKEAIYARVILYLYYRRKEYTMEAIAEAFNKTHGAICHLIKTYYLGKRPDELFNRYYVEFINTVEP